MLQDTKCLQHFLTLCYFMARRQQWPSQCREQFRDLCAGSFHFFSGFKTASIPAWCGMRTVKRPFPAVFEYSLSEKKIIALVHCVRVHLKICSSESVSVQLIWFWSRKQAISKTTYFDEKRFILLSNRKLYYTFTRTRIKFVNSPTGVVGNMHSSCFSLSTKEHEIYGNTQ